MFELNDVAALDVYVDGADEINALNEMIKGGGAALTREKIVAAVAKQFVCIVDDTKLVDTLGDFLFRLKLFRWHVATLPVNY